MTGSTRKLFLALLAAIALLLSSATLPGQTAPSGNQSQTDPGAAGKTAKQKTGDSTKDGATSSPSKASSAPSSSASNAATSGPSSKTQTQPASTTGMVWVNTDSGVYHKRGSRWYGKTKKGKYMLEADAIKAGYKLAK